MTTVDENAALRERLRADRVSRIRSSHPPAVLLGGVPLAELRRYLALFPHAEPEVVAVDLFRRIDSWEEFRAIDSALRQLLKERTDG